MSNIDHRSELDEYLLRGDRRLSWAIGIVIALGFLFAFAFAEPASPAATILAKTTSAVRG